MCPSKKPRNRWNRRKISTETHLAWDNPVISFASCQTVQRVHQMGWATRSWNVPGFLLAPAFGDWDIHKAIMLLMFFKKWHRKNVYIPDVTRNRTSRVKNSLCFFLIYVKKVDFFKKEGPNNLIQFPSSSLYNVSTEKLNTWKSWLTIFLG